MNYDAFLSKVGELAFFDLPTAVQVSGEERATLRTQLYRWTRAGKLVPLRRGMYTLADRYRRRGLNPAVLANAMYSPSYLSGHWALGFYGLIPEQVTTFTSVTPRVPRRFKNAFGDFVYRHAKQEFFFGYRAATLQHEKVMLAEPEKALVDLWHLEPGRWTQERMSEMRFQNREAVDPARLRAYAERFDSPRLRRAVEVWLDVQRVEEEGTVDL